MIMTQNQILLAEARLGFRYAQIASRNKERNPALLISRSIVEHLPKWFLDARNALVMGRNSTEIAHPQRLASTSD